MFNRFFKTRADQHAFIKRMYVCLLVTIASTCFFSMFWPLMVKGYQTDAYVYVNLNDGQGLQSEMQSLLASTIRTRFNDSLISQLINQTQHTIKLKNRDLTNRDIDSLRRNISVSTETTDRRNTLKIKLALRGIGGNDEKTFLRFFRNELIEALPQMSAGTDLAGQFRIETQFESQLLHRIENLQNQVANLDRSISELQHLAKNADHETHSNGPFRQISSSKTGFNSNGEDFSGEISQQLDTVAIKPLLEDLEAIHREILNRPTALTEDRPVQTALTTLPVNGTPHPKQMLILAVMALAIGFITAVNYNPLADRRFGSLGQIAKTLRMPIIATVPVNQLTLEGTTVAGDESRKSKWGNRLTHLASIFLAGFLAFVLTACIFNAEIRQQFFENPFHGLTRMIWILSGH